MISIQINAFKTKEQAQEFSDWFTSTGIKHFNEALSMGVPAATLDTKHTYDSHGNIRWSGNTGIIVLDDGM